jgi:hypothetical protein
MTTTVPTSRHLTAVPDYDGIRGASAAAVESADRLFRLAVDATVGTPLEDRIPQLVDRPPRRPPGHCRHHTSVYDVASRELDAALDAVKAAAEALTVVDAAWTAAGRQADDGRPATTSSSEGSPRCPHRLGIAADGQGDAMSGQRDWYKTAVMAFSLLFPRTAR